MTIAVVWQEDGRLWCAADTRLVAGAEDNVTTEIVSKIYSIPLAVSAMSPDQSVRMPHFRTQYGFAYAGSALPASTTAITAATLLQQLVRPGGQTSPPRFEEISEFVRGLSDRFIRERRSYGADALFSAAFFGWCPHESRFQVAHIDARDDAGSFRVELTFPEAPSADGEPWLVLGSGTPAFAACYADQLNDPIITKRRPWRAIEKMIADGADASVGGAVSLSFAHQQGFEVLFVVEPSAPEEPAARRTFNGLDLDRDIGQVGEYFVSLYGLA